jgi:cob(I)alamin adenosyltransferase
MARIYTRTGDGGDTGLATRGGVRKSDLRIEALGAVDETNACLGVVRLHTLGEPDLDPLFEQLQHRLFDLGADLASPGFAARIAAGHVEALEQQIDRLQAGLEPLKAFILPGGSPAAAHLHLARTVCRRAERALVRLSDAEPGVIDPQALKFLNRLSDLMFAAARYANRDRGDVLWRSDI